MRTRILLLLFSFNSVWVWTGNGTDVSPYKISLLNTSLLLLPVSTTGTPIVGLISFSSHRSGSVVMLRWQTAIELDNYGFEVVRTTDEGKLTPKNWVT